MPRNRKLTRDELLEQIESLKAYQEAFWALQRGEKPIRISVGDGDNECTVWVLGASRACGGLVLHDVKGASVEYVFAWSSRAGRNTVDPYLRELAHKVQKYCVEAIKIRYAV